MDNALHRHYLMIIEIVTTPLVGAPISGGTASGVTLDIRFSSHIGRARPAQLYSISPVDIELLLFRSFVLWLVVDADSLWESHGHPRFDDCVTYSHLTYSACNRKSKIHVHPRHLSAHGSLSKCAPSIHVQGGSNDIKKHVLQRERIVSTMQPTGREGNCVICRACSSASVCGEYI
eukprot:6185072-Pleurochrysis_carterae.AAC.2